MTAIAAKPRRMPHVVVAHPGRQYVYETVRAAQEAGALCAFATGVYLDPHSAAGRAVTILSRRFGRVGLLRSAAARSPIGLDAAKVVSFPYWAAAARLTWSLPFGAAVEARANRRTDASIARWLVRLEPRPDIVHGFEGAARATFAAAKRRGCTTVLDVANAHEYAKRELLLEAGAAAISHLDTDRILVERESSDVLVAPSDWVASCLVEHGVPASRIVKVPFGADPDRGQTAGGGQVFRAVFIGGVGLRKGVRYLLEAWRRLALQDAELVIVGGIDRWGRRLVTEFHGVARFEGQVPGAVVNQWLSTSDVFVFPSLAEGSAIVTYEALAAGLPVVTTPNAGSVVRDGVDGYVVPARDVDALCDRIRHLYENRDLVRAMGREGRAEIERQYTWGHYRQRLGDVYARLVGE